MVTKVKKKKDKKKDKKKHKVPTMQYKVKKSVTNDLITSHRINARTELLKELVIAYSWVLRLQGNGAKRIERGVIDLFEMMSDIKMGDLLSIEDIVEQLKIECKLDINKLIMDCADRHHNRVEDRKAKVAKEVKEVMR